MSQAVFAQYPNLTIGYVSQLERGAKRPTGAALVLLNVIRRKGIDGYFVACCFLRSLLGPIRRSGTLQGHRRRRQAPIIGHRYYPTLSPFSRPNAPLS
jgi:hypothetical protein